MHRSGISPKYYSTINHRVKMRKISSPQIVSIKYMVNLLGIEQTELSLCNK
jgi:hypothetical protein